MPLFFKDALLYLRSLTSTEQAAGSTLTQPTLSDFKSSGIEAGEYCTNYSSSASQDTASDAYMGNDNATTYAGATTKTVELTMRYDPDNNFHKDLEALSGVKGITLTHLTNDGRCKYGLYFDKSDASGSRELEYGELKFQAPSISMAGGAEPATITVSGTATRQTRVSNGA